MNGRLIRLPQEDCCQALSIPPTLKYQNEGGPGIADILALLKGSDTPLEDQRIFFKAQLIFWLIGATDGHAKNFSVFLSPGGGYQLTPLYDILTAQPALDAQQITRKQMRLAMFVGNNRHYRLDQIHARHFIQTAQRAGFPKAIARQVIEETADQAPHVVDTVLQDLPAGFSTAIAEAVRAAIKDRLGHMSLKEDRLS